MGKDPHSTPLRPDLLEFARQLATGRNVEGLLHRVAELARAEVSAEAAYLERIDFPAGEVEVVAVAGDALPAVGMRVPLPGSLAEEVIAEGAPTVVRPEEMALRPIGRLLSAPLGAGHSALVAPLLSQGEAVGAMVLLGRRHGPDFGPEDVRLVRVLADLAAVALRGMLSRERARERELELRAVLDVLPLPVFIADARGHVTEMNAAGRARAGVDAAAPPALGRAIATAAPVGPDEGEVESPEGRRVVLSYARPILDDDGRVSGGVAVEVDITERKEHEEGERFLADAGRILASSLDYGETLRRVAQLAAERIADWCVVYVPEGERMRALALAGRDAEKERRAATLEKEYPPGPHHPAWEVLRSRQPVLLAAIPEESLRRRARDERHLDLLRSAGFGSVMFVPMLARDEALGAIALVAGEGGRRFDADDLAFAERLADRAAAALDNARSYREAERRASEEEALRRAAAAVSAAFTIQEVIQQVVESALAATRADGSFVERIDIKGGEIELVAGAGRWTPPSGLRLPYDGSLAQEVIERGEVLLLDRADRRDSITMRWLAHECGPCGVMVVPLRDSGEPIGALILVRSADGPPFGPAEAARARAFGELAALAFRKIHLLEEAERRREEIERVTESRTRLIRGFSHDLKNPLGAADGYLALLEDPEFGTLDPRQQGFVSRSRRQLRAALDLLGDLVELHRAEAGEVPIQLTPLEIADLTREMTEAYRATAEAKGLSLELVLAEQVPVIESDSDRTRQIVGNLLSNAIKYTEHGGITVLVEERRGAGAPRPGPWIAVDVTDTGVGIPAHQQELIFREFQRLDPGASAGAGLGLAISQRIAEALGGAITLASEPGRGSTFTLWLPCARELPGSSTPAPLTVDSWPPRADRADGR